MGDERTYDIVLFGATGFVGRLVAGHLAAHAHRQLRVALAGRSEDRLAAVRSGLGRKAASWPLLLADSTDPASLAALAGSARVVLTAVGPYRSHGSALVGACAAAGTHYADLAGEVLFIRDTIDRYDRAARRSGARIVHSCGFDAIPSDLGVALLHEAARADCAGDLEDTTLVVTAFRGSLSGGTIATVKQQLAETARSADLRRLVADPYALSPNRAQEPHLGRQNDIVPVQWDRELGAWVGPFVMAGFNTRVVRRSNALQGWAYGRRFRYREVTGFGSGLDAPARAVAGTAVLGLLAGALGFPPARVLADRLLPAPGQGPGERSRRSGFFRMEIHTRTSTGARYACRIAGRGDPGYAATSAMLGESGVCLAREQDRLPARAGVLTPATGIGTRLVDRLRPAGITFEVERREP